jgi:TPR repeat protein
MPAARSLTRDEAFQKGDSLLKIGKTSEAIVFLERSAREGHPASQVVLASVYDLDGANRDLSASFSWFLRAAKQGQPKAQFNVGRKYLEGDGVERNFDSARYWYKQASDQGLVEAQYNLGMMYLRGKGGIRSEPLAISLLEQAGNSSFVPALNELGNLYLMGGETTKPSRSAAISWYRKAAALGDKQAQEALSGLGVR